MMGKPNKLEPKLFYHNISLEQRIPTEHPLRKIEKLVNFSFIRSKVANLYGTNGNSSIDPTVILKLMFLAFYENVKSERALMRQLPMRMDWLWFCGYDLDDTIPDHSVISKARSRWGIEIFSDFFENILNQCINADLVDGQTVHIDSSMINANASTDSLKCQLRKVSNDLYNQLQDNTEPDTLEKRVSTTDPDARLGRKYGKTTLGYKDHRSVDDNHGIVTATVTTPANINDEKVLPEVIDRHQKNTNSKVNTAVADKAYGIGENYKYLYQNGITPCISHKRSKSRCHRDFNYDKFFYDKDNDCYICPADNKLKRHQFQKDKNSISYKAQRKVCEQCPYFEKCVSSKKSGRQIQRNLNTEYIQWADNCLDKSKRKYLMTRRKYKAEGSFADASNNHGFKQTRFRGIEKVKIQNLMIAAIQNLRKLLKTNALRPACSMANSIKHAVIAAKSRLFRHQMIFLRI